MSTNVFDTGLMDDMLSRTKKRDIYSTTIDPTMPWACILSDWLNTYTFGGFLVK